MQWKQGIADQQCSSSRRWKATLELRRECGWALQKEDANEFENKCAKVLQLRRGDRPWAPLCGMVTTASQLVLGKKDNSPIDEHQHLVDACVARATTGTQSSPAWLASQRRVDATRLRPGHGTAVSRGHERRRREDDVGISQARTQKARSGQLRRKKKKKKNTGSP
jgi:hypothetical protein